MSCLDLTHSMTVVIWKASKYKWKAEKESHLAVMANTDYMAVVVLTLQQLFVTISFH